MENVLLENGDRRERRGEGGRGWSAEGEKKTAEGWTSFVVERIKRSQTTRNKKFPIPRIPRLRYIDLWPRNASTFGYF